jgi:hypothetical protein
MSGQTTRESDKFMLRLPDGMRDRIKARADAEKRSMNAEIVTALDSWLFDMEHLEESNRDQTGIRDGTSVEPYIGFVNDAVDVDVAVEAMTKRYADDLRQSMLKLLETIKK